MQNVLSLILGGGRGTRLYPLTQLRSKPAVPVAGKYRLIDIPISNCINSGCNRIYVLTQFLSVSLHRHIANTYKFDPFSRGFVEVLAAQQTNEAADWYQGTADAVRQQIRYVAEDRAADVLILSGDQLYRMDFRELLQHARGEPGRRDHRRAAGAARAGRRLRHRPPRRRRPRRRLRREAADRRGSSHPLRTPDEWMRRRGIRGDGRPLPGQHGHLPVRPQGPARPAQRPAALATDFGKEVFPRSISSHRVQPTSSTATGKTSAPSRPTTRPTWPWPATTRPSTFHSPEGVIYTRMRFLPASRLSGARLQRSPHQRRLRRPPRRRPGALRHRRPQPDRPQRDPARRGHARRRPLRDRRRARRQPDARRPGPRHRRRRGDRAGHPRQGLPHRPRRPHRQPPRRRKRRGRQLT